MGGLVLYKICGGGLYLQDTRSCPTFTSIFEQFLTNVDFPEPVRPMTAKKTSSLGLADLLTKSVRSHESSLPNMSHYLDASLVAAIAVLQYETKSKFSLKMSTMYENWSFLCCTLSYNSGTRLMYPPSGVLNSRRLSPLMIAPQRGVWRLCRLVR